MRRRIRLTGRKQLSRTSAAIKIMELPDKKLLTLCVNHPDDFKGFPKNSRIKIKLNENKLVEILDFGTLDSPQTAVEMKNQYFSSPSCELRIVNTDGDKAGLLLGSTDSWTLNVDDKDKSKKGILRFLPADLGSRTWKLQILDDDYPIVQINKDIPNPSLWAATDPVFISTAFPAILLQLFTDIFESYSADPEIEWITDWLAWAEVIMPGEKAPFSAEDDKDKEAWIEKLIDSFAHRHRLSQRLIKHLDSGKEAL